ncbi:hypothetical protein NDU88_004117 [Pleurodeles waltl]|uniref:Uncharacterized protein n=1 Tax=Pleurodeles waltl TaxID=8319 RepID=A0AAV7MD42_PLEWA|nr:hypothetical protein NDU88_004117 [Pleurodeles waltl]
MDGGNATTISGLAERTEPTVWGPTSRSQCKVDKGETGETSLTSCDTLFTEEKQGKAESTEIIKESRRETEGRVTSQGESISATRRHVRETKVRPEQERLKDLRNHDKASYNQGPRVSSPLNDKQILRANTITNYYNYLNMNAEQKQTLHSTLHVVSEQA